MKDSQHVASFLMKSQLTSWASNSSIKLRRLMSRPAGCAFLGSSATTTKVWLGEYGKNQQTLVADSGSDITLISQKALSEIDNSPRLRIHVKCWNSNSMGARGYVKERLELTPMGSFDVGQGGCQLRT